MPKISIDLFGDTFQAEEKSPFEQFIEALTDPFTVAFLLLFGVGAPLIMYIQWRMEQ